MLYSSLHKEVVLALTTHEISLRDPKIIVNNHYFLTFLFFDLGEKVFSLLFSIKKRKSESEKVKLFVFFSYNIYRAF